MAAKESQEPFSRPAASQRADEKKGRSPGEQADDDRLRVDVPAVQAAEEWQRTFDAVPDLIAILDTQHRIVRANKAMAERLGLTKDQCVGQTCYRLVHGTDEPPSFCPHSRLLQDGEEHAVELHEERLAGDFLATVSPLRDSAGRLVGSVCFARDITERKQAEDQRQKLLHVLGERVKELRCMYGVASSIRERETIEEVFRDTAALIPATWQYPEITCGRVRFDGREYVSEPFQETEWSLSSDIVIEGRQRGAVDVYYLEKRPELDEGPFLKEERHLIDGIARSLSEAIGRKQADHAVVESERKFRAVFENAGGAIFIADIGTGKILDCNLQAEKLLGRSRAELVGMHQSQLHPEGQEEKYRQKFAAHVKKSPFLDFEGEVQHSDGRRIPVCIAAQTMTLRGRRVIVGLFLDISERKQMEETLRESNELFEKTFTSQRDAIFILDARSPPMILDCNPATTEVFGYTRQEMLGRTTAFLHVGETKVREFQDQLYPAIAQRAFLNLPEFEMKRKGGTVFPTEHTVMPLEDNQGELIGWVSVVRDISARKCAEEALRESEKRQAEAEKLAATGRMAAQMAHEINNPLAGIKNCFRLIRDAVPEDHPDHDMVGRIEREIDRIAHVVRQMHKLHSSQAERPTDIPVEETIRDVLVMLEPLRREHEVTIELAPVSPKLIVTAPEGSLQQVVYNLTANAIQASPRSGVVNIVAEPVDKDYVRISVRDQGPGIPAEVRDRMFESFFSADTGGGTREGIGLGLSIVRSVVESLEGKIEFESRVGEGTCFHVYLPSKQP